MSMKTWETFYPPKFVEWVKKTLDEVERSKQESRQPSVSSYWIQVAQEAMSQTNFEEEEGHVCPPNYDIKTSPLIDFSSFQIHKKDFSSLTVYGHIKLTTDYGREFFLFKREIGDPMVVKFDHGNNNTFTLPESKLCNLHWLPKFFWLELYLVDKNRTLTLVNEEFLLDFCRKVVYDTEQKIIYDAGRYGVFTVTYTIYHSAALGSLAYDIFQLENEFSPHGIDVCVSGTISAAEGQHQLSYKSQEFDSAILSTNNINSFPIIAVPVYSRLKVKVDLVVDGQHILGDDDSLIFKPARTLAPLRVDIVRGKWCISVTLFWIHAFAFFPDDVFVGEMISYHQYLNSDVTSESEDRAKSYIVECQQLRNSPVRFARYLGEVFSVSISSFDHRELYILGTIKLNGYAIFEKNENNTKLIKQHQLLSLINPECCYKGLENGFVMNIDLKDSHGDEFCKGCVVWDSANTYRFHDRRMCSVIIGDFGYSYVHYALFDSAIQANVNVRFVFPVVFRNVKIYGKIYARYNTYRYSTDYEKKYFRIMLFKKGKKNALNFDDTTAKPGTTFRYVVNDLPLLKDVIAVPCDASLILEVELLMHCVDEYPNREVFAMFKDDLTFNPTESVMLCTKKITRQADLEVEVKWS